MLFWSQIVQLDFSASRLLSSFSSISSDCHRTVLHQSVETKHTFTQTHTQTHTPPAEKLHQFLGLEEALEVSHLPNADGHQDEGLDDGPPEDPLVGALTGLTETLLTVLREDEQTAGGTQQL